MNDDGSIDGFTPAAQPSAQAAQPSAQAAQPPDYLIFETSEVDTESVGKIILI
jgi:hypothetical protein